VEAVGNYNRVHCVSLPFAMDLSLIKISNLQFSLLTGLYLVNLEVTIVSTSLVSITNDLDGFKKTSWVVTGFLTTYTGGYGRQLQCLIF
jgi:hypothetical protein